MDNEGTFNVNGVGLTLTGSANVNGGRMSLSTALAMPAAALTNRGMFTIAGGVISGSGGALTNSAGGTISGTGTIQTAFVNGPGATVSVAAGAIRITQPWTNNGFVQLTAFNSNLNGGAVSNNGTIQGIGNISAAVTNSGQLAAQGGSLYVGGALVNSAAGTIRAGAGSQLFVASGLATNAGVINLADGTFDNNGHSLANSGQITGSGTLSTGGAGLDNNGLVAFSGGATTVIGNVTNESGHTISASGMPALFAGLYTNNQTATLAAVGTTITLAGGFTNNVNSTFVKSGDGAVQDTVAPSLNSGSSLAVNAGTLRFAVGSGSPAIGTGVAAIVSSGATLELAGPVSALASATARVNVVNNSVAPGILVSGTNQQVGNIDGNGSTQVNAGRQLTANHIIQSTLTIGGTASAAGLMVIAASDGNGVALANDVLPFSVITTSTPVPVHFEQASPVALGSIGFEPVDDLVVSQGGLDAASSLAVPEPSSLVLTVLAIVGLAVLWPIVRISAKQS